MQYVIILALLYFLFSSSSKKKKRAQQQKRIDKGVRTEQPVIVPEAEDAPEEEDAHQTAAPIASAQDVHDAPALAADTHPEPVQAAPDAPMSTLQGETHAEHAAHDARVQARERAETQRAEDAQRRKNAARQRLREAVIMREILDKPVSLRGRRMP